jgi:hypothetical protein
MDYVGTHFDSYGNEPLPIDLIQFFHADNHHAMNVLNCFDGVEKLRHAFQYLLDSVPDIQEFRKQQEERQAQQELERKAQQEREEERRRQEHWLAEKSKIEAEARLVSEALDLEKQARLQAQDALKAQAQQIADMRAMLEENQRMMSELMAQRTQPQPQPQPQPKAKAKQATA